jgi:hypothetical protein
MGIFPFEDSQYYSPYIHTSSDLIGTSVNSFEQVGIFTKAILATTVSMANMITPPKNLVAIPGNEFITLTWDGMTGADSYNIYKNGNPVPFSNSLTTTFVDDDVLVSTAYTYYVTAVFTDTGEESDPSNEVSITLLTPMAFPFVEDFEAGTTRWNFDSPWGLMTGTYHSATHSLTESPSGNYTSNLNISAYLYPFSLRTATTANFSFWTRYVTESGYDYLYAEISTDGSTWTQLASYNGSATSWSQKSFTLTSYLGQPYVHIRFRFYSDESVTGTGVNIDDINLSAPSSFSLNLSALLEGPFDGSSMNTGLNGILPLNQPFNPALPYFGNPMPDWYYNETVNIASIPNSSIVDWILVELRDAPTAAEAVPGTTFEKQAAFVTTTGQVVKPDGTPNLYFNYSIIHQLFIIIYHRTHISVMSANAPLNIAGNYFYDFTIGAEQAYGEAAQKEVADGVWAMYCGDGNGDCMVDLNDITHVWKCQGQTGRNGYLPSDFNLDGQTNNPDKNNYWKPNIGVNTCVQD